MGHNAVCSPLLFESPTKSSSFSCLHPAMKYADTLVVRYDLGDVKATKFLVYERVRPKPQQLTSEAIFNLSYVLLQ